MNKSIIIDSRLKSKIEELMEWNENYYSVKFKDLNDTFWFSDCIELQKFLHEQVSERFYDKSLRKGYFDYINEYDETFRYHIEPKRGTLTLLKEECLIISLN